MPFGNSGFPWRVAVPEGLRENSPAFQRREGMPEVLSPEGTVEMMGPMRRSQSSLRDGGHGQGLGLLRVLRNRFRVGGSVRRGRRTLHARARVLPILGMESRPSLRDSFGDGSGPGVETPGYSHPVPSGQKFHEFPRGINLIPQKT